jgi:hypothetical protein
MAAYGVYLEAEAAYQAAHRRLQGCRTAGVCRTDATSRPDQEGGHGMTTPDTEPTLDELKAAMDAASDAYDAALAAHRAVGAAYGDAYNAYYAACRAYEDAERRGSAEPTSSSDREVTA